MIANFKTQAMKCGGCANNIRAVLGQEAGVKRVEADPASKRVTVEYDEHVSSAGALAGAMAKAGYPVDAEAK